jgi:hypothetical protein
MIKPIVKAGMACVVAYLAVGGDGCRLACVNEALETNTSPDGKLTAITFRRNCGPTTQFTTDVSIVRAGQGLPRGSGNVLQVDTNHGAAPTNGGGGPSVRVRWVEQGRLLIEYDLRASLGFFRSPVAGVVVTKQESVLQDARCPADARLVRTEANESVEEYCVMDDGRMSGLFVRWDSSFKKQEAGDYRDGLKDGVWTTWLADGTESSSGEFIRGSKERVWTEYDSKTRQHCVGSYAANVKAKDWKCF